MEGPEDGPHLLVVVVEEPRGGERGVTMIALQDRVHVVFLALEIEDLLTAPGTGVRDDQVLAEESLDVQDVGKNR